MLIHSDVSFVIQGPIDLNTSTILRRNIETIRRVAQGSRVILSTWNNAHIPESLDVDDIVLSDDIGPLPDIKGTLLRSNNVNRQILGTRRGLERVDTRYAIKMRSDCELIDCRFLDYKSRVDDGPSVLVCSLFTLDPTMFEHVPFHVSDWFQFARTDVLRDYWNCRYMTLEEATYYRHKPHAKHSSYMDRKFRSLLAVEQFIATQFAASLGYKVPSFHNDIADDVMKNHARFMRERIIILDPVQIGLVFKKYEWAMKSGFQRLNCLSNLDWQIMVASKPPQGSIRRNWEKRIFRTAARIIDPIGALIYRTPLRTLLARTLRWATR